MFLGFLGRGIRGFLVEVRALAFAFTKDAAFEIKLLGVAETAVGENLNAIERASAFAKVISERVETFFHFSPDATDAICPTRHAGKLRGKMGKGKVRFSLTPEGV